MIRHPDGQSDYRQRQRARLTIILVLGRNVQNPLERPVNPIHLNISRHKSDNLPPWQPQKVIGVKNIRKSAGDPARSHSIPLPRHSDFHQFARQDKMLCCPHHHHTSVWRSPQAHPRRRHSDSRQIRSAADCASEISALGVGAGQIGVEQIGADQLGIKQVAQGQIGPGEISAGEISAG